MRLMLVAMVVVAALSAQAADRAFLDDRSTPQQLLASFYNAIERQEPARAYSYLGPHTAPADFDTWAAPFYDVAKADLLIGEPVAYTTAGYIAYDLPVMVGFTDWHGKQRYEVGCIGVNINLSHDAPPPYEPMQIMGYRMQPADGTVRLPTCED